MLGKAERRVGAGASVVAHLALLALVLAFTSLDQSARRQGFRTEVSFELLPQSPPVVRELQEERSKPETGAAPPLRSAQEISSPDLESDLPDAADPLPANEIASAAQPNGQASPLPGTVAGSGAGASSSSGPGAAISLDRSADWIAMPSAQVMNDHYPLAASRDQVSGSVVLACLIDSKNRARNCRVLKEQPKHYLFGNAALNSARTFLIRAPVRDGKPRHDIWVQIPISFNISR